MKTKLVFIRAEIAARVFVSIFTFGLTLPANLARADVMVQLGDQDFANGQGINGVAVFNAAAAGEPVPFDSFRGSDLAGSAPFSESWTFNYAAGAYVNATLTLGIADHDSQATGSQIVFFGFDGNDLTSLLNTLFESSGGRQFENNIYSVNIPALDLADLTDGTATFTLTLQGPSLSGTPLDPMPGSLPNNGAGLDFARLDLAVPEPGSLTFVILAVASLTAAARCRKRNPVIRAAH